jgi:tRNA (adenine-N(1)-)-methyltransferase non-catalytic subunit
LIKNNESFDKKTDFSKAKYIKKKDKKYLRILTPIQPTARTLCEHFFEETPQKILNLRVDSLSQILTHANVHVGCRTLVVDETEGIVVSALMERMGLEGELLMIHNNDIQKMKIPAYMNFSVELWERTQKLPWTKIQDDGKEGKCIYLIDWVDLDVDGMVLQPGQTEEDLEKFKRQISNKIKGVKLGREALNKGSFDALIIATDNDPTAIIEKLLPYVAPSRPVVVYNPHKEYLVKPYLAMRGVKTMINVRLTDSWMREYQVPVHASGTHPIMTMSGHGGFILTGLKVLDNEVVHAYTKRDKAQKTGTKKKMKLDEEDQAE